jgi:hypothetical protein
VIYVSTVFAQTSPGLVRVYQGSATAPSVTITVSPSSATIAPGGAIQFSATVTGTTNTGVTWAATGGTISSSGQYLAGLTTGTFQVTAKLTGGTASGSAPVTISSGPAGIEIPPGQNIQTQIDSFAEGTVFRLKAGVHRLTAPLLPRNSQQFVGEAGAIISGARVLTAFSKTGSAWSIGGQSQEGSGGGECRSTSPRCMRPEDVFINDVRMQHVGSLSAGGPGKWYFDYGADTIYIWDDPTGKRVETSVTPLAFGGSASNVTISGLVIEKFASPAQNGAVKGGTGWRIDGNEIRFNHGIGLHMASGRRVVNNYIHHNGQMGIGGASADALVENNEIAYNNTAGYNDFWEAGGTKFVYSNNLTIRNNFVHHNDGPGLWTDIDNIDVLYEGNRVEDNGRSGIFHEISYRAIIRRNTIKRNGTNKPYPYWIEGAGIQITDSTDVEVYENVLEDNWQGIAALNENRGTGRYGPWTLKNLWVHHNQVTSLLSTGGAGRTGVVQTSGGSAAFTNQNNRFDSNVYRLGSLPQYFLWLDADRTEQEWRQYGQDVTGSFAR